MNTFATAVLPRLLPDATMPRRPWPLLIGLGYIALIAMLGGLRMSHVVVGSLALLDYYSEHTRRFLRYFLPMVLVAVAYDSMRYYYWDGVKDNIHVAEPYLLEKALFGIFDSTKGGLVTPNEYFEHRIYTTLDLLCGFAYIFFIAEYLLAGLVLFVVRKYETLKIFSWSFFVVNIMGYITYFIYPAAPPWYVTGYGLGPARLDVRPSAAACARFDEILGTHFFSTMYGEGIDVFGSIPSLHVSYPLLVCWVAWKLSTHIRNRYLGAAVIAGAVWFYLLMCFSAVYLQHHYLIDVILGSLYAIVAFIFVYWVHWVSRVSSQTERNNLGFSS